MRIILITLLLSCQLVFGTTYYVSNSGDNGNSGTSVLLPWATISKVNSSSFNSGDRVLFNRGDLWRESLIPGSSGLGEYITFGCYGTGNKPKIYGSKNESQTTDWVNCGTNLWSNKDATFTVDVSNLIFNGDSCGVKTKSLITVDGQGDFFYSFTGDSITMFSVGNPATIYGDIECALDGTGIYIEDQNYIILENFDIRYWGTLGVNIYGTSNPADHVICRNLDVSYIGAMGRVGDYSARYGNGIGTWDNASNIFIYNNRVDNCYDAGISPQGTSGSLSNIWIYNNIITNCDYSFEYWIYDATATANGVYFYNNTCIDAGYGWSRGQRWDAAQGSHFYIGNNTATTTNFEIKNNIFSRATNNGIQFQLGIDTADVDIDYNIFNVDKVGYFKYVQDFVTLSTWITGTGNQDVHSISADPLLNIDYTIPQSSPAVNSGINVGLSNDYFNNPIVGRPDIGASEYRYRRVVAHKGKIIKNNGKIVILK